MEDHYEDEDVIFINRPQGGHGPRGGGGGGTGPECTRGD